ncbi:cation diffusion facilitator family transporter [Planococcus salinus]|uniref:Cation transporter n=1 Tax=Planococcus salinus TaxID=1848460 RepID=A0A3M8P8Q9_9BACL|nr:cation diffusion facilitator family transporter [Planococcus salinus]RNF39811.1 cation transporter [Planococcus salinus]
MSNFRQAILATWIGIAVNVFLTLLKGTVGFITDSRALMADAAHSASDIVSSIAVLAGLKIAQRPPDSEHPYGHGKAENIATIIVGLLLIIVGVEIAISSIEVFWQDRQPPGSFLALSVVLFSIVCKELLYQYKIRLGKKINSPSLVAEAWHHRSDALSSLIALIGIGLALLGTYFGISQLTYFDPIAGLIISIFVIKTGISLGYNAAQIMLEKVLSPEETKPYLDSALEVPGIKRIDTLHARNHGSYLVIDIKISVEPSITVEEGHRIGKATKHKLLEEFKEVNAVLVHVNPYSPEEE